MNSTNKELLRLREAFVTQYKDLESKEREIVLLKAKLKKLLNLIRGK